MFDGLAELVAPLDEAGLNWTPPASEANSIADLVYHILGSLNAWFSRALDEPFERDRDAEFESRAAAPDLLAAITRSREAIRGQLERLDGVDGALQRQIQRHDAPAAEPLSVGWCIAHAIIHAGEHWGQIRLTRDLYAESSVASQRR